MNSVQLSEPIAARHTPDQDIPMVRRHSRRKKRTYIKRRQFAQNATEAHDRFNFAINGGFKNTL
jgi:hypothetical protein